MKPQAKHSRLIVLNAPWLLEQQNIVARYEKGRKGAYNRVKTRLTIMTECYKKPGVRKQNIKLEHIQSLKDALGADSDPVELHAKLLKLTRDDLWKCEVHPDGKLPNGAFVRMGNLARTINEIRYNLYDYLVRNNHVDALKTCLEQAHDFLPKNPSPYASEMFRVWDVRGGMDKWASNAAKHNDTVEQAFKAARLQYNLDKTEDIRDVVNSPTAA